MFDEREKQLVKETIANGIIADQKILDSLIDDLRRFGIKTGVRKINHYTTTTLAIVSTDGGNHSFKFNPFHHQLIRVVDSDGQPLAIKALTLSTDLNELFKEDRGPDPHTGNLNAIGRLINDLEQATGRKIQKFSDLCGSITIDSSRPEQTSGWVVSYRDLWEWAVLYERIMYANFAQSTLIVRDGLLRTKLFQNDYFRVIGDLLAERIKLLRERDKKEIFFVGLAKHSSVIDLYRLALSMENIFPTGNPYWVRIPREIEVRAYKFEEFARGRERLNRGTDGLCARRNSDNNTLTSLGVRHEVEDGNEDSKFVFGTMHFVRLAPEHSMPIWVVDIFDDQISHADRIIGHLYGDSVDSFPVPSYPMALQRAHEAAKLTDFDSEIINRAIMQSIRSLVGNNNIVDRLELAGDLAARRY
ncbi:MAG: hypothetical protein JSR57_07555 [Verrucomicrobia bacterium]|nr:hypothetical protein [Verrucomicrobiota bacterium]